MYLIFDGKTYEKNQENIKNILVMKTENLIPFPMPSQYEG
jgi:hypothetical protein